MALFYADASALVKLVWDEPESDVLRAFLVDADLVSSELVDAVALLPLDRALLLPAGALAEPALRALDAIHVASAWISRRSTGSSLRRAPGRRRPTRRPADVLAGRLTDAACDVTFRSRPGCPLIEHQPLGARASLNALSVEQRPDGIDRLSGEPPAPTPAPRMEGGSGVRGPAVSGVGMVPAMRNYPPGGACRNSRRSCAGSPISSREAPGATMQPMPRRNGQGIALLADETRRRIIALLAVRPMRPSAVARELGLSRPAVSRQLALLHKARLVRRHASMADRRAFLYSVDPEARGRIIAWLAGTEVGLEEPQSTIPNVGSA